MDAPDLPCPTGLPDWLDRFAYRLRRQWPTVAEDDLRDVARDQFGDPALSRLPPEQAAVAWLRRGVLVDHPTG